MKKGFLISLFLILSACHRIESKPPSITFNNSKFEVNGDTVAVNEINWKFANIGDYPFITGGDIACNNGNVEFYPKGLHEQDIGLPLNQAAQNRFKQANLNPNVPNVIKFNADLSQAVKLGLMICEFNHKHEA